ncbi:MAG: acetylornithine deacetylase [Bacteroidetes bacterium GWE2_39_28]|nr:MAG: acetylornithine deacetylase [Bacteroidetes bacterium GWE2_39_28]OFY14751.1 MAG: acetylornithine deacetylase [Bacteroidetes bacterium GWF2_39_10]OFZ07737.1 MAG: acetylornithine deacetylase [Bacteroidetes bacterium RIFOXYB2_FULL_39_7]OFZ10411.1 MAG: acetylornithine deacetylase [Bacteroidetes bacterium RIFOXYC2_FULL_39_11]HCT93610.1 acetylornithine deacetylase [Rikenellaceae bacterium]
MEFYINEATDLLKKIIAIPSYSGGEGNRADFIYNYLTAKELKVEKIKNNLITGVYPFSDSAPVLMLNSHIDTVLPSSGYTMDPFDPQVKDGRVYGLGSNDAGASVVSMTAALLYFSDNPGELPFNLTLLLSAEEENSGPSGVTLALKNIDKADCIIVGEPTNMKCALAERGLLVIDGTAEGVSGHAAREEGINSIYIALEDIAKIKDYKFSKVSRLMGEVKMTVTQISAGHQHNVVPDTCKFVIDIRPTDVYDNNEIVQELKKIVKSNLIPRNLSNRSSSTPEGHPLLICAKELGVECYTSPTTSDWMRHSLPAIKMGPGDSSRSHRADEYICIEELKEGITGYINFIKHLKLKQ